jgi:hypothetical protein
MILILCGMAAWIASVCVAFLCGWRAAEKKVVDRGFAETVSCCEEPFTPGR